MKLQKLLLRPLDDRNSASRGSSRNISVRGYSRQTETYVSSLSNSVDNSGNDILGDEDDLLEGGIHYSALYPYQRPGSRALSMPIKVISGKSNFLLNLYISQFKFHLVITYLNYCIYVHLILRRVYFRFLQVITY